MTGFATQKSVWDCWELTWELKSVNNRFADATFRLPETLKSMESDFRSTVTQKIRRGRIDASLSIRRSGESRNDLTLHAPTLNSLCTHLNHIQQIEGLAITPPSSIEILKWPGVLTETVVDIDALGREAKQLLKTTLDELISTRREEGHAIGTLIGKRCEMIEIQVEKASLRIPQVIQGIRDRLQMRIQELPFEIDLGRLEQELVYHVQKMDVAEELDRLRVHLVEIKRALQSDEPVGRRLDFLAQELNREANTLGSKSQDTEMTKASVEIKVLIEQIKEQVQNVE